MYIGSCIYKCKVQLSFVAITPITVTLVLINALKLVFYFQTDS